MRSKAEMRKALRETRRMHAQSLPESMRGLVFRHPPAPLLELIPQDAAIGLYHATADEAPMASYAGFFLERRHRIALPRIGGLGMPMKFHGHTDPFGETDLIEGPLGLLQPCEDAESVVPTVLLVPLVGFTDRGERLGQGGGFYDRWLAEHPDTIAIGVAWDCQLVDALPVEDHDKSLDAVVTPTRFFGPF